MDHFKQLMFTVKDCIVSSLMNSSGKYTSNGIKSGSWHVVSRSLWLIRPLERSPPVGIPGRNIYWEIASVDYINNDEQPLSSFTVSKRYRISYIPLLVTSNRFLHILSLPSSTRRVFCTATHTSLHLFLASPIDKQFLYIECGCQRTPISCAARKFVTGGRAQLQVF